MRPLRVDATTHYLIGRGHRGVAFVTGVIRADGVVERRYRRLPARPR
jgi:hypothetical protein